jgi:glutamate-ammonia-ligase adenylyltransferase
MVGATEELREALGRLQGLGGEDQQWSKALANSPNPIRSLTGFERWAAATSSPSLNVQSLAEVPGALDRAIFLFGASPYISDILIQNPELCTLFADESELGRVPTRESLIEEGQRLLHSAQSPSHRLDRLRFLKQRTLVVITSNDLEGRWTPKQVWQALSDLADACITLASRAVSAELGKPPDMLVVGFGKLGGHELNYSSDVDLVYAIADGLSEDDQARAAKFCAALGRALETRMGRGSLFRVDLRLRPYGAAGALTPSMRAVEKYYELYAEPWEVQALLRSRPIFGEESLAERWEALRSTMAFPKRVGEQALNQMREMRGRIEEFAEADDLKRGAGGIRDVEFLTQILQVVHGNGNPDLQVRPTLEAIRALEDAGWLDHAAGQILSHGYTFLRQMEHRCQLVGDQQTHRLPATELAREELARLMNLPDAKHLVRELEAHRRKIQTLYRSMLNPEVEEGSRAEVARRLGAFGQAGLQWFDLLPEGASFYASLAENEGSLQRVHRILEVAPRLVPVFRDSLPLTEMLLSGEIEESRHPEAQLEAAAVDYPLPALANLVQRGWASILARYALTGEGAPGAEIASLTDALLRHCVKRLYLDFDLLALGSHGAEEMGPDSDADLVFLVKDNDHQREAEAQAQSLISLLAHLHRLGAPVTVDLRLRPDGGRGLLVRTYAGLAQYDFQGMEMWERLALCQARLVHGNLQALALTCKLAYALPLTPERLKELVAMKRRIETERLMPQHLRRDVKLGQGGLNDIEWFVHLHEMRYPTATEAGRHIRIPDRIRALGRADLINAAEVEELLEAHSYLLDLRLRIGLLGFAKDIIPENPDRLDRLARSAGWEGGNALLAQHEALVDRVRAIYIEGLERLRA